MKSVLLSILLCSALLWAASAASTSKARKRRNLIFNNPNPRLQFVVGIGVPLDLPHQAVTTGLVVKGNYLAPYNSTMYTRPLEAFPQGRALGRSLRRTRERAASSDESLLADLSGLASRWQVYETLQLVLEQSAVGMGRQCLLRSVCDAAAFSLRHEGLLGEFLQVFLSPSSTQDPVKQHHDYEFFAAEHAGRAARDTADPISTCRGLFRGCATEPLDLFTTIFG